MYSTPASAASSTIASSGHRTAADPSLRSEAARPIAFVVDHGSTAAEKYQDKVSLSADGLALSRRHETGGDASSNAAGTEAGKGDGRKQPGKPDVLDLTIAEQKIVDQLQQRDREVKTHEMAHLASAGQYARGGPTYSYQMGPDGRRYAVGGEVAIDLGKEQTPEQTAEKMRVVKRAALAPAEPSATDRQIAATATAMETEARREIQDDRRSDHQETTKPSVGHRSVDGELDGRLGENDAGGPTDDRPPRTPLAQVA